MVSVPALAGGKRFGLGMGNIRSSAAMLGLTLVAPVMLGQAAKPAAPVAPQATVKVAPLQLQSLDSATRADPFPPVNPKFFTADAPTVAIVDGYLKALLGWDANRIWRVEGIQKTTAPGVSKVIVYVTDRASSAKVQTAIFFVTPDGKNAIADGTVNPFGATPYADARVMLQKRADGPFEGAAAKDLELVEFSDLQCPHCKDAQAVVKRLLVDFPKARFVFENFPLTDIHPFAFEAATHGVCAAQKSNEAFFTFAQAVYDTQGGLTADAADQTLKTAATKAGLDPAAIATCAAGDAAKAKVTASMQLGNDLGVSETPELAINGRLIPLNVPYETLKSLIVFQAGQDGVSAAAASPEGHGLIGR